MSKALDRAKAHYRGIGTLKIQIEEWSDEAGRPFEVYYSAMTAADYRDALPNPAKPTHENLVDVVILKALDEKGEPHFSKADKPELMLAADHEIISRIASNIISKTTTVRDAGKN